MSLYYYKDMFRVENLEEAKNIILTEEAQGGDHRQRWERETTYMQSLFAEGLGDLNGKTVLDFGCGIGRLSKALAETGSLQTDCAIAVYVLQHVYDPAHDIGLLEKAVRDKLLVLNLKHRAVPVIDSENGAKTFYLDEQPEPSADVGLLLAEHFEQQRQLELAADKISVVDKHWCRIYGKKESK